MRVPREVAGCASPPLCLSLLTSSALLSTALCPTLRRYAPQPRVVVLAFRSAAVWSPTSHTSSLDLRLCPPGPRDVQRPSQACLQCHRRRGTLFPKQGLQAFLRSRCWEWGLGPLTQRAGPGSFPPGIQLRAWHAGHAGIFFVTHREASPHAGLTQLMLPVSGSKRP